MRLSRGWRIGIGGVVVVAVVAAVGVKVGLDRWDERCAAHFAEMPAAELNGIRSVPFEQVDLSGLKDVSLTRAQAFLDAARNPDAVLGKPRRVVVAADDGRPDDHVKLAGSDDGDIRFSVGPGSLIGTEMNGGIVQVDDETGRATWGRQYAGYGAHGGAVGDFYALLEIPHNRAPQVAAVKPAGGGLAWCTKLGKDVETGWEPPFTSTGTSDSLYVARPSDRVDKNDEKETDVWLTRVDTQSGDVGWNTQLPGVSWVSSVDLLADKVLLTRQDPQMYYDHRRELLSKTYNDTPIADRGAVIARSAADGSPAWTYRGPDDKGWVSNVVGVSKGTAVVVSRRSPEGAPKGAETQTWLTGIDKSGKELWRQDLKSQLDYDLSEEVKVTGGVVVTWETAGAMDKKSQLVGRDATTGAVRWRAAVGDVGVPLRTSALVGNTLLTGAIDRGLLAVDLTTGAISRPFHDKSLRAVSKIVSDGRTVTISYEALTITFDQRH